MALVINHVTRSTCKGDKSGPARHHDKIQRYECENPKKKQSQTSQKNICRRRKAGNNM